MAWLNKPNPPIKNPIKDGKYVNIARVDDALLWYISETAKAIKPSPAEVLIADALMKYGAEFYQEVSFEGLRLPTYGYPRFDFLVMTKIPDFFLIEFDGAQYHQTQEQLLRDRFKNDFCSMYNIALYRFDRRHYYKLDLHVADVLKMEGVLK